LYLVTCYLLLVACCLLLVACCLLLVACYLLLVACCLLLYNTILHMKTILTLLSFFTLLTFHAQNKDEQTIRAILAEQTVQWNKGDIDAFMKGYWNNDSLMFVGKSGVTLRLPAHAGELQKELSRCRQHGQTQF
jgi:predicted membrane metal-binding protein